MGTVNCEILRSLLEIGPRLLISSGDLGGIHKYISFFAYCHAWLFSFPQVFLFCNLSGFVLTLVISLVLRYLIQQKERFFVPAFTRQTDHFIIVVDHL
jgi:hypothetical protein